MKKLRMIIVGTNNGKIMNNGNISVVLLLIDGDTIIVDGKTYQIIGIDAPEYGQKCLWANGYVWECGKDVTDILIDLLKDEDVKCEDLGRDKDGRILSYCADLENSYGEAFVAIGFAWLDLTHSNIYEEFGKTAQIRKSGVWEVHNETAKEFRAKLWAEAVKLSPNGCPVKALRTMRNGATYFAPWSKNYSKMKVDTGHGGKWFCSEKEAREAGFEEQPAELEKGTNFW